jgi:hypothetical protein
VDQHASATKQKIPFKSESVSVMLTTRAGQLARQPSTAHCPRRAQQTTQSVTVRVLVSAWTFRCASLSISTCLSCQPCLSCRPCLSYRHCLSCPCLSCRKCQPCLKFCRKCRPYLKCPLKCRACPCRRRGLLSGLTPGTGGLRP